MNNYYRPDFHAHQQPYHRAQRRRRVLALARRGGAALAVAAIAGLAFAAWSALGPGWLVARVASLPLLRLERTLVSGNATIPTEAVLATAGLVAGESLLGLDLGQARARLLAHPRVHEAVLHRRLPGTITVEIVERVPFAVARAGADLLVDAEGAILGVDAGASGLPVLAGLEISGGSLTAASAADLAAGIELVAAIRQVGFPALAAVDHIDLADPEDTVIVPKAGRPLVHVGRREPEARLRLWRSVAPDMAQRWPELEYVDLRPQGQVVALPAAPPPEEGAAAKPGVSQPQTRPQRPAGGAAAGRGGHA